MVPLISDAHFVVVDVYQLVNSWSKVKIRCECVSQPQPLTLGRERAVIRQLEKKKYDQPQKMTKKLFRLESRVRISRNDQKAGIPHNSEMSSLYEKIRNFKVIPLRQAGVFHLFFFGKFVKKHRFSFVFRPLHGMPKLRFQAKYSTTGSTGTKVK